MKKAEKQKKNEAREDMETGDTARSGTLSGTPPEYETTATDFLSQLAPPGLQFFPVAFVPPAPDHGYERTSYLKPAIHHLSREAITLVALCLLYALEAFGRERKDLEHFRQQTLKVGEMQEDGNSRIGRANFVEGCATLRPGREIRSQGRWTRCQSGSSDSFQGKNSEPPGS